MTTSKLASINPDDLLPRDAEMEELINKNRDPSEVAADDAILKVVRDQRLASIHGLRTGDFDKVASYVELIHMPLHKRLLVYMTKGLGLVFGIVLLIVLIFGMSGGF